MKKLNSFAEFSAAKTERAAAAIQEEQEARRSNEATTFKSLLAEYGVGAIKELSEEQKSEFFEKLRGAEVNEAIALIEEGTRGQFGKIDKKGNITSVYIHYDSYPENILPLIKKGYKGGKNVDTILKSGASSGLESTPSDMNFYNDGTKNSTGHITNIAGFLREVTDGGGAEYVYLWDEANKEWLMADTYAQSELVPAFESVTVSVNEAIQVQGKRDAKKVVTVYNRIFNKQLTDFGAMTSDSILGCIKYLYWNAMEDANFSREGNATMNHIKGSIAPVEIKLPGLNGHFVKIGGTTIKKILDKYYVDLAAAAGWSGIGIVEGTALYLEQIKQEPMGQALLVAFNSMFESATLFEATVEMDAMDPDDKDFLKFLKKHKVEIIDKKMDGPGGGTPVITMQGKRKDLEAVLADEELGWADADLAEYIEESLVNERKDNALQDYVEAASQKTFKGGGNGQNLLDDAMGLAGHIDSYTLGRDTRGYEEDGFYGPATVTLFKRLVDQMSADDIKNNQAEKFESLDVNEAEIKSDDDFKEYAMTVLKKAFGADFDEAKANDVVNGILGKAAGDYGKAAGILTSSLGESVVTEAKEFSFIFNYNTDEDDVSYIQNILKKAGVNATAEAGLDSEEMEVKAANAIELRKAKKAIEADGFEINEAIDTKYWADYNTDTSGQGNKEFAEKSKDFEDTFSLAVAEWNDEADGAENRIIGSQVDKVKKIAQQFFKKEGYISVNIAQAMIAQES